jgi:hypothetical protein
MSLAVRYKLDLNNMEELLCSEDIYGEGDAQYTFTAQQVTAKFANNILEDTFLHFDFLLVNVIQTNIW